MPQGLPEQHNCTLQSETPWLLCCSKKPSSSSSTDHGDHPPTHLQQKNSPALASHAALLLQKQAAVADVQRRLTAIKESQESWKQKLPERKDLMQQLQSKDQELAYAENFNYVVRDMLQQLSTVVPLLHNKLSNVMETQAEMGWFTSIMQNASQKLALLQATRQQQQQHL